MAMHARPRSGPGRRVQIYVPPTIGTFLDLVCKYGLRRKAPLVDQIWAAGLEAVFGKNTDELTHSPMTLPPEMQADKDLDLYEFAALVCGGENDDASVTQE
jgi:uncharacterized protein (DUF1810 family)